MATIIVTGASGMIGRAVVARLSNTHDVVAVSRRSGEDIGGARVVVANLTEPALAAALPRRADAIIHLAQAERYDEFPDAAKEVLAVNLMALARLLDWARTAGVKTFVHASTGGLYGRSARPFTEADPVRIAGPLSFYFRTKQCAELLGAEYAAFFNVIALRPFFVYGRGQRPQMLVPRLISSILEGHPIRLAGSQGMRLNPLHVSDMAAAIEKSLSIAGNTVVNVAGPEILSIRDMAEVLASALERDPLYEFAPEMAAGDIIGDISCLRDLGWAPTIRLRHAATEICRDALGRER